MLAGYMRIVGPAVLAAFAGRILNTHPSLLPAFPGAHAVARRARPRRGGHRLHGPPRRRDARRRPDRRPGGGRRSCPATTRRRLHDRIRAVEHRLLPRASRSLLAGAVAVDGRRATGRDRRRRADAAIPTPAARAAVGLGQDRAGRRSRRGLVARRLRARVDRRHGAGAARRRPAGDRRGRRDRLPGDARRPGQDAPSADPRRAPGRSALADHRRQLLEAGDRAVRARRRQPVSVRGRRSSARASRSTS